MQLNGPLRWQLLECFWLVQVLVGFLIVFIVPKLKSFVRIVGVLLGVRMAGQLCRMLLP